MTAFISCEKNEYVQPDRDVVTQDHTGSDRDTDDGNCDGHGGRDGNNCGGG